MTPYINTTIRAGSTGPQFFNDHWDTEFFHVTYDELDPTFTFNLDQVRILISANNQREQSTDYTCAPVGYVRNITPTGFDIVALNTDIQGGQAGFTWLAVAEAPDPNPARRVFGLRMGLTQPLVYEVTAVPGDWQIYRAPFSRALPASPDRFPLRLLSGSNHGRAMAFTEVPQHSDLNQDALYQLHGAVISAEELPPVARPTVAAVGVATDVFPSGATQGVTLLARNQDATEGQCAFYHVALGGDRADLLDPQMLVETGTTPEAQAIEPASFGGWAYATEYWHIYFSRPFLTPPVVLVSATDQGSVAGESGLTAVQCVGQAHDVTPYGFTLVARNASNERGKTFLHWVALGCSEPFLV